MSDEKRRIEAKFTRFISTEDQCPCGYLPFPHVPEKHLYRTNEELISEFETLRETLKQPPKYRKGLILELKCRVCGNNERSEYHRISSDEAGYHVRDWEPEFNDEWRCPDHPGLIPIETFHDFGK